jgi:hypothetical protein
MTIEQLQIGSSALARCGFRLNRPIGDWDFIVRAEYFEKKLFDTLGKTNVSADGVHVTDYRQGGTRIVPTEYEIAYPGSTAEELLDLLGKLPSFVSRNRVVDREGCYYAREEVIFTMKMTHRFKRSPHFEKTRTDIFALQAEGYTKVPLALEEWAKKREKESLKPSPKLNQPKEGFFADHVRSVYDHDSIHEAMATWDEPVFRLFQKDGAEVMVDREKWDRLTDAKKVYSVVEETMVIALERHQIPNDFAPDPRESFRKALQHVCTSLSSGWWREYAWQNYDRVLELMPADYVARFRARLSEGVIKPYGGGKSGGTGAPSMSSAGDSVGDRGDKD